MSVATIPDEVRTYVAIEDAKRIIDRAKGYDKSDYYGLRNQEQLQVSQVAYAARLGDALDDIRGWVLRVALIRDAQPSIAERFAANQAVAS